MNITDVRITKLNSDKALKAFATITLNGEFVVSGLGVLEGQNGAFVKMPQRKAADGTYKDTCFPLSKELRQEISDKILQAYGGQQQNTFTPVNNDDDLPF